MKFKELIDICKGHNVYIQTHNFPDPDAIGSAYGLQNLLKEFDIDSKIIYEGRVEKLSTLKMFDIFKIEQDLYEKVVGTLSEEDYIICVDSQKNGGNIKDFVGKEIAAIDHHPTYCQVDYLYSDIRELGACATIITQYYREMGIKPGKLVATALLYGIRMDTSKLTRGVTQDDLAAYEYLFSISSKSTLNKLEKNNLRLKDLKAYGEAIEHVNLYGRVAFSEISFDCSDAMIATLSDFMLSLVEVKIAIVYSVRKNGWKFSIRSETEEVDAGALAHDALEEIGNGGGHLQMAGGFVPIEEIKKLGKYPQNVIRDRFLTYIDDKYEID